LDSRNSDGPSGGVADIDLVEPIIELKDIEKSFGKVTALQGISLKMHPAEVHCLLGDNGAGIGVIFIMHNVHHAWAVGNAFTILNRGRSYGTFLKSETNREKLLEMMAGGERCDWDRGGELFRGVWIRRTCRNFGVRRNGGTAEINTALLTLVDPYLPM
jgi:hypothetical protein